MQGFRRNIKYLDILTEEQIETIHQGTLQVLERTGLRIEHERALKLLEKKRLVNIEPGKDQRERVVTLTDNGIKALVSALPHWEEAQHHVAEICGEDRIGHMVKEISHMVSMLRKE